MHTTSIVVTLSESGRANLAARSLEAALRAGASEIKWADLRAAYGEGETAFDLALVVGAGEDAIEVLSLPGDPKPTSDGRRPFRVDLSEDERELLAELARREAAAAHVLPEDWETQRRYHPAGALSADVRLAFAKVIADIRRAAEAGGDGSAAQAA